MTIDSLLGLSGNWKGEYNLWLDPESSVSLSTSTLSITSFAKDRFVRLDYS